MKFNSFFKILFLLALSAIFSTNAFAENNSPTDFVTVKNTQFIHHNKPYYIVGTNLWYGGYLGAPSGLGDRARLIRELDNLKAIGINNLRVMAVSEKSELATAVTPAVILGFDQYDENLLIGLDFLLNELAKRDMTAVLFLNNFWQWSGGMTQYQAWLNKTTVADPDVTGKWNAFMQQSSFFYQHKKAQIEYQKVLKKIIARVNTVNGKAYIADTSIMAWQLANEPRPGADGEADKKQKLAYKNWINDSAKFIKTLDKNHLVSSGSEGLMGTVNDEPLFKAAHASPYIDYLTYHLWVKNWSWFDAKKPESTWDAMLPKALEYMHKHYAIAKQLNKPIVLEEFGLDRDYGEKSTASRTHYRDQYYKILFDDIYQGAKTNQAIAGFNFWAWNGSGRAASKDFKWRSGDNFLGDPPQEPQGLNGVFDSDITTILIIKDYANKFQALQQ